MNFKTTLLLILVLAGAGFGLFLTRNNGGKADKKPTDTPTPTSPDGNPADATAGTSLFDVKADAVAKVVVTPAEGTAFTLDKSTGSWRLTAPVDAAADAVEVDTLLRDLTDARSRNEIDPATDPKATGLDAPRYKVDLTTTGGKALGLSVGERAVVGDNLYVRVAGHPKADLVAAALADQLDKGADPYRSKQLVAIQPDQVKRIRIVRPDQPAVLLQKTGTTWAIAAPTAMPADESATMDLVYAVTGLRADSFADPKRVPPTALARPQVMVSISTVPPTPGGTATTTPSTTGPTTTMPTTAEADAAANWTTVSLGSYDGILKRNVYASVTGGGVIAKVPASVIDSFGKTPLDLRDKAVVDVDPALVTRVSISVAGASTSQPAVPTILERRKAAPAVMGPMPSPTTGPATTQAATKPTTVPASPASEWVLSTDKSADGDDARVVALLAQFHPLRTEKFRDPTPPTTAPFKRRITVELTTKAGGPPVAVTIVDAGNDGPLLGTYNGVTFELPATLATDLTGDFHKGVTPAPPAMPAGLPPGLLGR